MLWLSFGAGLGTAIVVAPIVMALGILAKMGAGVPTKLVVLGGPAASGYVGYLLADEDWMGAVLGIVGFIAGGMALGIIFVAIWSRGNDG